MTESRSISQEKLLTYLSKEHDNYQLSSEGKNERGVPPNWKIGFLIDGRFQGLIMPLMRGEFGESLREIFPLEEPDLNKAKQIAESFNSVNQRLCDAKLNFFQCPSKDEVKQAFEDIYFMLTPITPFNWYLRELIAEGMSTLGIERSLLPRQAYEGDPVSIDQLKGYQNKKATNYVLTDEGTLEVPKKINEPSAVNVVHSKCSGSALQFAFGDGFEDANEKLPVKEGITAEQAQRISRRFTDTQAVLETAIGGHRDAPSKEWVVKTFSDYHNMLQPTTVLNRYLRTLIEQAMDAMGLDDKLLDARSERQFAEDEREMKRNRKREDRKSTGYYGPFS